MFIARFYPLIHLSRLTRPTGIWLLMLPCWWGTAFYCSILSIEFYSYLVLFLFGATCLRTAGCVFNDWIDQSYDRQVSRTKNRPLASYQVSYGQAFSLFILMMTGGGLVWISLNTLSKICSLIAFGLLILYPFMKRITQWPQFFLGLAFNSGVMIACTDIHPLSLYDIKIWFLYMAGILWTLAYDTIYAFQDIKDDQKLGLGSTAILFKRYPKKLIWFCYGSMILFLGSIGILKRYSFIYFTILFLSFSRFFFLLKIWKVNDPKSCFFFFKKNVWLGFLIFIALVLK